MSRWRLILVLAGCGVFAASDSTAPIHFVHRALGFTLETSETPEKHAPETMAGGVAVFDFNGDGHPDIFFTNGADIRTLKKSGAKYSNRLYAGDGRGGFVDVTAKAGVAGDGYDMGVAVGDYDNDGCPDLFVAGVRRNTLYHNNCNGTFRDVTAAAGIVNRADPEFGPLWAVGAVWLDVNNDGLLDLFVVNYLAWDFATEPACDYQGRREYCHPKMYKKLPNQLWLNLGGGKFKDISKESGIRAHPGKGMGAAAADFDLDGRMDLFVANDKVYNQFFHNLGGGKFEERAFAVNTALRENGEFISGMGVDFRDLNNDGYPDIVFVALDDETFPIFRNTGKGDFVDATNETRMGSGSLAMAGYAPVIADFDNDGWKDIFVSRGHVQSPAAAPRIQVDQHNSVFRNLGGTRFAPFTAEAGFTVAPARRHRGAAVADLDGDGKLDVVVSAIGAPAEIWMNDSAGTGHWIGFSLRGHKSNRDGIGARIRISAGGATQYNHMSTAAGYSSSSAGPVRFGLEGATVVDEVEIRWPSGLVQTLRKVPADRVVTVEEPTN